MASRSKNHNAGAITLLLSHIAARPNTLLTRDAQNSCLETLTSKYKLRYNSPIYGHTSHNGKSLRQTLVQVVKHHGLGGTTLDVLFAKGADALKGDYVQRMEEMAKEEKVEKLTASSEILSGEDEEEDFQADAALLEAMRSDSEDEDWMPTAKSTRSSKTTTKTAAKRKRSSSTAVKELVSQNETGAADSINAEDMASLNQAKRRKGSTKAKSKTKSKEANSKEANSKKANSKKAKSKKANLKKPTLTEMEEPDENAEKEVDDNLSERRPPKTTSKKRTFSERKKSDEHSEEDVDDNLSKKTKSKKATSKKRTFSDREESDENSEEDVDDHLSKRRPLRAPRRVSISKESRLYPITLPDSQDEEEMDDGVPEFESKLDPKSANELEEAVYEEGSAASESDLQDKIGHLSIKINALVARLVKECDSAESQPAQLDSDPTPEVEELYIHALGDDWRSLVSDQQRCLRNGDFLRCAIASFLFRKILTAHLPWETPLSLASNGMFQTYVVPLLEDMYGVDDIGSLLHKAAAGQLRDHEFRTKVMHPAAKSLGKDMGNTLAAHMRATGNEDAEARHWRASIRSDMSEICQIALKLRGQLGTERRGYGWVWYDTGKRFNKKRMTAEGSLETVQGLPKVMVTIFPGLKAYAGEANVGEHVVSPTMVVLEERAKAKGRL